MTYHILLAGHDFPVTLATVLSQHPAVNKVSRAVHPYEIKSALRTKPDLVFIGVRQYDYRMFDEVTEGGPRIVFVCGRLDKCAHEWLEAGQLILREPFTNAKLVNFFPTVTLAPVPSTYDFMVFMHGRSFKQLLFSEIEVVEHLSGNYVKVYTSNHKELMVNGSLTAFENRLPEKDFLRPGDGVVIAKRFESQIDEMDDVFIYKAKRIVLTHKTKIWKRRRADTLAQ